MTHDAERTVQALGAGINRLVDLTPEQRLAAKTEFQTLILDVIQKHLYDRRLFSRWIDNQAFGGDIDRFTGIRLGVAFDDGSLITATIATVTSADMPDGFKVDITSLYPGSGEYRTWSYEVDDTFPEGIVEPEGVYRTTRLGTPELNGEAIREALEVIHAVETGMASPIPIEELRLDYAAVDVAEISALRELFERGTPIEPPSHWVY